MTKPTALTIVTQRGHALEREARPRPRPCRPDTSRIVISSRPWSSTDRRSAARTRRYTTHADSFSMETSRRPVSTGPSAAPAHRLVRGPSGRAWTTRSRAAIASDLKSSSASPRAWTARRASPARGPSRARGGRPGPRRRRGAADRDHGLPAVREAGGEDEHGEPRRHGRSPRDRPDARPGDAEIGRDVLRIERCSSRRLDRLAEIGAGAASALARRFLRGFSRPPEEARKGLSSGSSLIVRHERRFPGRRLPPPQRPWQARARERGRRRASADERFMRAAIEEAEAAEAAGDVPVGAVVVDAGGALRGREGATGARPDQDPDRARGGRRAPEGSARAGALEARRARRFRHAGALPDCAARARERAVARVVYGCPIPRRARWTTLFTIGRDPRLNHPVRGHLRRAAGRRARAAQGLLRRLRQRDKATDPTLPPRDPGVLRTP